MTIDQLSLWSMTTLIKSNPLNNDFVHHDQKPPEQWLQLLLAPPAVRLGHREIHPLKASVCVIRNLNENQPVRWWIVHDGGSLSSTATYNLSVKGQRLVRYEVNTQIHAKSAFLVNSPFRDGNGPEFGPERIVTPALYDGQFATHHQGTSVN